MKKGALQALYGITSVQRNFSLIIGLVCMTYDFTLKKLLPCVYFLQKSSVRNAVGFGALTWFLAPTFPCPQVMFTACELGVFDLLLESGKPLSSDAIAAHLGTSTTGMERLLDACVGLKLLAVELTQEGALYRNTEISNIYLTKSSPKSQYHIMMYYSNTVYLCWHYLADAVREGRNQYERAFGISYEDPFGAMYRSEEEMLKFMAGQNSVWSICGRDVLAAFDLSPFRQICDLGGGGGALAQECVSLYPNSMVTIYDLPKVVQVAKEQFVPPEEHRITFHEDLLADVWDARPALSKGFSFSGHN
ncbi:acetylserotonin O-methyltransferase isoform X3 [Phalacrocorax carbo]|uniref:acetylserotonin O-methyltransferase isoform X3 n=1 Tax=Phalacrocorax carbo TaxID=9209 RepID=UPI00311A7D0E